MKLPVILLSKGTPAPVTPILKGQGQCPRHAPTLRHPWRIHGVTLRDKVRSHEICKALNVETLLQIERFQLRWFGHLSRMPRKRLAKQVLLATRTGERLRGRPRTRWSDYNCNFGLGVESAELSEIAVDREVSQDFLWAADPATLPRRKVGRKMNENNEYSRLVIW